MTSTPQQPPAGWYPDPAGTDGERFWDGVGWSSSTRDKPTQEPTPPQPYQAAQPAQGYGDPYQAQPTQQPPQASFAYGYATRDPYAQVGPRAAGFWWRVLGYVLDSIVVAIVANMVSAMLGFNAMMDAALQRWVREVDIWSTSGALGQPPMPGSDFFMPIVYSSVVTFVVFAIYRTVLLGTISATLGQLALGLRSVPVGGDATAKLTWGAAALRGILGAVIYSIFLLTILSGILVLGTTRNQNLSDLASKTQVLKVR